MQVLRSYLDGVKIVVFGVYADMVREIEPSPSVCKTAIPIPLVITI